MGGGFGGNCFFSLAALPPAPVGISKELDPLLNWLEMRTIVRHFAPNGGRFRLLADEFSNYEDDALPNLNMNNA